MELLCDADILSVLAKVKRLDLLRKAFPDDKLLISESVYDELAFSKEEGFDFPERIFKMCETVSHDKNEVSLYERWREDSKYLTISKADLRTLIMARERNLLMLSNDSRLLDLADQEDVLALDIYDILKILYRKEELSEEEVRSILSEMEEKDNAVFEDKERIFEPPT